MYESRQLSLSLCFSLFRTTGFLVEFDEETERMSIGSSKLRLSFLFFLDNVPLQGYLLLERNKTKPNETNKKNLHRLPYPIHSHSTYPSEIKYVATPNHGQHHSISPVPRNFLLPLGQGTVNFFSTVLTFPFDLII